MATSLQEQSVKGQRSHKLLHHHVTTILYTRTIRLSRLKCCLPLVMYDVDYSKPLPTLSNDFSPRTRLSPVRGHRENLRCSANIGYLTSMKTLTGRGSATGPTTNKHAA